MSEEFEINSTKDQLKDFIEYSPIWKDIRVELIAWLGNAHMLLENPDCNMSHQQLDQLSGRARTIREVIGIPEVLLETLSVIKK